MLTKLIQSPKASFPSALIAIATCRIWQSAPTPRAKIELTKKSPTDLARGENFSEPFG